MNNLAAFLEGIRTQIRDHVGRLAFADWLDEHDEPLWAELIRVQCSPFSAVNGPQREKGREQKAPLLKACQNRFLAPLQQLGWTITGDFTRGFVERAELKPTRHERLVTEGLRAILDHPIFGAIVSLTVYSNLGDSLGALLASVPSLSALSELELLYPNMGDAGLAALALSPHLCNLRSLRLVSSYSQWHHRRIGGSGLRALAGSPAITHLEKLDLTYNGADADGMSSLSRAPFFSHLIELGLCGNRVGDAGAGALASAPHTARLAVLDLSCNGIGDEGVEALAASPVLANVTSLSLGSHHMIGENHFGTRGALALARSPYLDGIQELKLLEMERTIDASGWDALRARFGDRLSLGDL